MESTAPLDIVRSITTDVAAKHADDVDQKSRFPSETLEALKGARLLSALVPREFGGAGATMRDVGMTCATLAQGCGSSAMVLAMHHIQVACIARHGLGVPFFRKYLSDLVANQYLIGSVTSEVGTSGDTRSSICAVERDGDRFTLVKDATTVSYGAYSDSLLVTARRAPDAPQSDQVLVLLKNSDFELNQTTSWDTMGMRGTCSPGYKVISSGPVEQIVPGSFADSSAQTMVPYSHILWSSLWYGVAAGAFARAATFVRADARRNPGTLPPTAQRLAKLSAQLQSMRHGWTALADEFDHIATKPDSIQELSGMGWALKMNNLKIAASEAAPRIVHEALQITGIMGFKNDSKFSVGRHYRDTLSAALMVSNERVAARSAPMLLVFKDDQELASV